MKTLSSGALHSFSFNLWLSFWWTNGFDMLWKWKALLLIVYGSVLFFAFKCSWTFIAITISVQRSSVGAT